MPNSLTSPYSSNINTFRALPFYLHSSTFLYAQLHEVGSTHEGFMSKVSVHLHYFPRVPRALPISFPVQYMAGT